MSRTGLWMGVGVVALSALLAVGAWAQEKAPAEKGAAVANRPLLRCFIENAGLLSTTLRELGLTPEQKERIGAVLKAHQSEIAGAARNLKARHDRLLAAVRAEAPNEAAIRAAGRDMADALGDAAVLRARIRREVLPILNADQRARIAQMLQQISASVDSAITALEAQ